MIADFSMGPLPPPQASLTHSPSPLFPNSIPLFPRSLPLTASLVHAILTLLNEASSAAITKFGKMQTGAICPHVRTARAVEAAIPMKRLGLQQRDRTPLTAKAEVPEGRLATFTRKCRQSTGKILFCCIPGGIKHGHSTSLNHPLSLLLSHDDFIYWMKHRMPLPMAEAFDASPMIQ
jgi:hypothetical protein